MIEQYIEMNLKPGSKQSIPSSISEFSVVKKKEVIQKSRGLG